jgi:hypothetical protein
VVLGHYKRWFVIMKRKRLTRFVGVRVADRILDAMTRLADERDLAVAELSREYIEEGLRRDGAEV